MPDVIYTPNLKVSCEICLKEIPASEAKSAEGQDYFIHFCGLECYDMWRQLARTNTKNDCVVDT